MSAKMFNIRSWFSTTIFLLYIFGYIHICDGYEYCDYYIGTGSIRSQKLCPNVCCPNTPRRANITCCNPPPPPPPPTFTLFGYSWWTIFLCVICLFTAISIFIHYSKRLHFLKHSKYFNGMVEPALAFTISKSDLKISPMDSTINVEQNPPSYISSIAQPSPPPYASVNP